MQPCRSLLCADQQCYAQVPWLVGMAKKALDEDKCVVIGLQSTGEARTADLVAERGDELDDFVSGPQGMPVLMWFEADLPIC